MTTQNEHAEHIDAVKRELLDATMALINLQGESTIAALIIAHVGALLVGNSMPSVKAIGVLPPDHVKKLATSTEAMRNVTLQLLSKAAKDVSANDAVAQLFHDLADRLQPH